jgi:predicted DNA-binding ribbon-helix-helix protein
LRFCGVHIGDPPPNQATTFESQQIQGIQYVFGQTLSVEDEFWDSLKEIAGERGTTLAAMIGAIDGDRKHANLSSAVRLFVLGFYRDQIARLGRQ